MFWNKEENTTQKTILALLFGASITFLLREIIALPRPHLPEFDMVGLGNSFPSGHIVQLVMVFGFLSLTYKKISFWIFSAVLVFCVGISRLFYGYHYLDDVIGGFILGSFLLYLFYKFIPLLEKKKLDFSVILLLLLVVALPFTLYFLRGHHARHNFLLLYFFGFLIGYILNKRYIKITILKKRAMILGGILISFPFTFSEIVVTRYFGVSPPLLFSYFNFFSFGLFVTFFWPLFFSMVEKNIDSVSKIKKSES